MTENLVIVKTKILDPEEFSPFKPSTLVFCRRCFKRIEDTQVDDVFKITYGMVVGDVFFPEKRTFHYHKECLASKK